MGSCSGKIRSATVFVTFSFEHDTAVIVTKTPNNKNGDHSTSGRIIRVEEGLFLLRGYIFKIRKRTEVPWARERVAKLDADV